MRFRGNPTWPLPELTNEIALMTRDEFLGFSNPDDQFHPSDAYDTSIESLNYTCLRYLDAVPGNETLSQFWIYHCDGSYIIKYAAWREEPELVAVIIDGVLYYSSYGQTRKLPTGYVDEDKWTPFEIHTRKRVKYLEELLPLIERYPERNLAAYPILLQRIKLDGEFFELRARAPLQRNSGIAQVLLNSDRMLVAAASNEWGATLVQVAREYQRRGLGSFLAQQWYDWNPSFKSGGFTPAGQSSAISRWENRVRLFRSRGWYSELVRRNILTLARVQEITKGLRPKKAKVPQKQEKPKPLMYVEYEQGYWGPTFVVYDERFFTDPDRKYIYGFGFFRDGPAGENKLYTIDYEKEFAKLTTYLALQIARANEESVYIRGDIGDDYLELEGLAYIDTDGIHAMLTRDVLPLREIAVLERHIRNRYDKYDEKLNRLIEQAHAKWL